LADSKAETWVSLYLGQAQRAAGLPAEALQRLERTQALARRLGDEGILAAALAEAALVHAGQRDWPGAAAAAQSAADLHRKLDDKRAQARDLVDIGVAFRHQSRLDEAKSRLEDGLRLAHSSDDSEIEAWALFEMAAVNLALSNPGLAREHRNCAKPKVTCGARPSVGWSWAGCLQRQGRPKRPGRNWIRPHGCSSNWTTGSAQPIRRGRWPVCRARAAGYKS